jgi:hypothetical protein
MTKKEMFATIATVCSDNAEIVEFCNHEIELLENRKSGKKGMTATQKANVAVKETILTVLGEIGEAVTVSEMMTDERLSGFTNQKLSALLSQLVKDGKVVKTIEGKKARFALA